MRLGDKSGVNSGDRVLINIDQIKIVYGGLATNLINIQTRIVSYRAADFRKINKRIWGHSSVT